MSKKNFSVDVRYYDADHETALKKIPRLKAGLAKVAGKTIEIPEGEFLTYSLFTKLGTGPRRFATLASIQRVARHYAPPLYDYFSLAKTLKLEKAGFDPEVGLRERIGVALGLSTISRIHGMGLADWVRIPVMRTKHLDFQLASTGRRRVQVETKGSVVSDNTKRAQVSGHASSITSKKNFLASRPKKRGPWEASVRYGTIAAIDSANTARVWLLDPEPHPIKWNPDELQLLARFGFLAAWLSMISPQSQVSWAMRKRYGDLVRSEKPLEFNEEPLLGASGQLIGGDPEGAVTSPGNFFYGKLDFDGKLVVRSVPLRKGEILLLGARRDLLSLAVEQNFAKILEYRTDPTSFTGTLRGGAHDPSASKSDGRVTLHLTSFGTAISFQRKPSISAARPR